ncbi:Putative restriction endonuclease domain-containing protein [Deinococcus saxicola]|uniref:Uma2 family endonuclease n=1 Tax=Deinococcus saxicola TaxID=249406 RepID=UPI0039EF0E7B
MTEAAFRKMSEQEYLRLLEGGDVRYEFIDGFVYAQAGATNAHNQLALNLALLLQPEARKRGCRTYQNDMRLRLESSSGQLTHYYPDLMVSCEPATRIAGTLHLTAPCLIVEILSRSTGRADKNEKWKDYQTLESLEVYLMVDSLSCNAALYRRTADGWAYEIVEKHFTLPCPEMELSLAEIYDGVPL